MLFSYPNNYVMVNDAWRLMAEIPGYGGSVPANATLLKMGMASATIFIQGYREDQPGFLYAFNNEESILVIGGANGQLARRYYTYHIANPFTLEDRGVHHIACIARDEILRLIAVAGYPLPPRMTIVGHSFGGVVGAAFYSLKSQGPLAVDRISLSMVGSPRPGNGVLYARSTAWNAARIFGQADPVPYLLPHSREHPGAHAFLNDAQSLRFNSYEHVGTGYCLRPNGIGVKLDLPDSVSGSIPWALETWAISSLTAESANHGWGFYNRLLTLAATNPGNNLQAPVEPFINVPLPNPVGTRGDPAVRAARAEALRREVERRANPPRPSDVLMAYVEKRRGLYVVMWQKEEIGQFKTRKLAGRFKRDLNELIMRMGNAMNLSTSAWLEAMTDFFARASAPGGGSNPPLYVSE
jgi:hypothetical protein